MKWGIKSILFFFLFLFISNVESLAYTDIDIDGEFNDWKNKPYINDYKYYYIDKSTDFTQIRYFCDDEYLYVYAKRTNNKSLKAEDSSLVITNAIKGVKQEQYILGATKVIYAPQFDINTSRSKHNKNKNNVGNIVNVSYNGENIESTFSASYDNKDMEFRVPLKLVGLDGGSKEVRFMMKYYGDKAVGNVYWVPSAGPITITTGPSLWKWTYGLFFLAAFIPAYKIYDKLQRR